MGWRFEGPRVHYFSWVDCLTSCWHLGVDETKRRMALAREAFERPDPLRIVVPAGEWGQWFTDGARGAEGPR
jgi:hypothetical protein